MSEQRKRAARVIPIAGFQDAPDYYDILQVTPDASHAEIVRAYRRAKETYKLNSLTTYSLFDDEETERALARIEEAYQILASTSKRHLYDQARKAERQETGKTHRGGKKKAKRPGSEKGRRSEEFERLVAGTRVFSGAVMCALRKHLGISLDDIADRTKISKGYLKAIENEEIALLPQGIYRKSFIRQYAAQLGLDPDRVLATYPPLHEQD